MQLNPTLNGLSVKLSPPPAAPPAVPVSVAPDVPWWDLPGQARAACEEVLSWIREQLADFGTWLADAFVNSLDVGLPLLAGIGIIWWMCPFFPRSDNGAKLTGLSLICYMFFCLLRGVAS